MPPRTRLAADLGPFKPVPTDVPAEKSPYVHGIGADGNGGLFFVGEARRKGLFLRSQGDGCETVASPRPSCRSIWAAAPDDVWIVTMHEGVVRWNGDEWSRPQITGKIYLPQGVWGAGPRDVWVVGNQRACVMRWNGVEWSKVDLGVAWSYDALDLSCIWGSGPRDVWIGGSCRPGIGPCDVFDPYGGGEARGVVLHWDGARWSRPAVIAREPINRLWGAGADDVWAVTDSAALVWDGIGWSERRCSPRGALADVAGTGPDDVWLVGNRNTILHWDGQAITDLAPGDDAGPDLRAVHATRDQVWVAGSSKPFASSPIRRMAR